MRSSMARSRTQRLDRRPSAEIGAAQRDVHGARLLKGAALRLFGNEAKRMRGAEATRLRPDAASLGSGLSLG